MKTKQHAQNESLQESLSKLSGLELKRVAELSGIHYTTVYRYRAGESIPNTRKAILAKAIGQVIEEANP